MGYYTKYDFEYVLPDSKESSEATNFKAECEAKGVSIPLSVHAVLDERLSLEIELEKYLDEDFCEDGPIQQFLEDKTKWYEHEEDMLKISNSFPTVLFKLKGEGEESGDLWIKYFKDGKVQRCMAKITFDEFDESKMR